MINKLFKSSIVKNASWLIFGRVAQMVISLFVGILTARYLGPSNYGLINYASSYLAFFMAFCTLGINSILVKELIDHPQEEGKILGSSIVLRGISSLLSALMIVCIVSAVDYGETITIQVTALCSLGLVFNVFEVFNFWFQAKLQSKVTALASLLAYISVAIYKIFLLITQKSVAWFAFATSIEYVVVAIVLLFCYCSAQGRKLAFSKEVSKRLLSSSYHFIFPSLMVAIYGYTDKLMLKQMLNEAEVGYYATATAICAMWCFVLQAIIDSMFPAIMESFKTDREMYKKRNRQLYCIVFYVSMAVSALFCLLGELVVYILYGKDFLPAAIPLKIVSWYTAFSYLGVARNAWIVCENKQNYLKYIYVFSAICNIVLNFLLIPQFGASGAAVASLLTQISTIFIPLFFKGMRENTILIIESIFFKGLK